jgi:hypothetical protein
MVIETHMVTIVGNVAMTNIAILALMLSTWPFTLELDNDSPVQLRLFRKKVDTRDLCYN